MAANLTPAQITETSFRRVRKGYDSDEVDGFLAQVAKTVEVAQQQATAMEARARAAVARLKGSAEFASTEPSAHDQPAPLPELKVSRDESETISRTLLLAQRTADIAVAEAHAEADRIKGEAEATIASSGEKSNQLIEEARNEARRVAKAERKTAENEFQALKARREFLIGDVDQLEKFLAEQGERLRSAARQIEALVERIPAGLGQVRPPTLSASDDESDDDTTEQLVRPEAPGPDAAVDQGAAQSIPADDLPTPTAEHIDDPSDSADDPPTPGDNRAPD